MKREVEIKAQVENIEAVIRKLETLGCIVNEPLVQEDVIYSEEDIFEAQHAPNPNVLRIRTQTQAGTSKTIFTFKRNRSNELDCIEHETEIGNASELEHILSYLGYKEVIRVHKTRRKATINDLEICCDRVEGLGDFIEVEKLTDADGETVQAELWQWLEDLDLGKLERMTQGYDTLLYNKLHS